MAISGLAARASLAICTLAFPCLVCGGEPPPAAIDPPPAHRVETVSASRAAEQLVREALRSRLIGKGESETLLARALEIDPRSAPAHWHSGFVHEAGNWIKYDAVADVDSHRRLLDRYETERGRRPDTLEGHLALAGWCGDQKLTMQERAHMFKVLEFDPDHAIARARLGFLRVGDRWISRSEAENTRRRKFETELAFKKWSTVLKPIRLAFESGDPARIAAARRKLAAIRDPDAIPALETMLSRVNLEASSAVVLTIRQMAGPDAAVGLARQAVFADWYPAGKEAAEALRDYDEMSYVPLMLSALATRADATLRVTTFAGAAPGRLLVRYEFERERQDRTEKVTYDVSYGVWTFRVGTFGKMGPANTRVEQLIPILPNGAPAAMSNFRTYGPVDTSNYYDSAVRARAEGDQARVAGQVEEESRATEQLNARICRALRTATGTKSPEMETDDPRTWWTWWDQRREVFIAALKPTVSYRFANQEEVYVPRYARPLILPLPELPVATRRSCLVAGTPIWTDAGPRPVERIQLGDRVLAQNVETGELAYRAVLTPTVRPAAPTVVLKFGERTIQATGGHPFWVVGRGWVMARELEPGTRLASVGGTVELNGIEPAAEAPAYNLVVDEFHSYFVGEDRVLSHDNLPPHATPGGLPGEASIR